MVEESCHLTTTLAHKRLELTEESAPQSPRLVETELASGLFATKEVYNDYFECMPRADTAQWRTSARL